MPEQSNGGEAGTGYEIAIVGMAGRFPGADDLRAFWHNLRAGVESITFFTRDELVEEGIPPALLDNPDFVPAMGVLCGADELDAALFGLTPRDAEVLDPQHRLLLECAWSALEHAGHDPARGDRPVGVFAGSSTSTYLAHLRASPEVVEAVGHTRLNMWNEKDQLAAGVSYRLNLQGPSVSVQTACSTSLVAVHLACQSLATGECDVALAGGVSVRPPLRSGYLYTPEGISSPDGHVRAFDADARGTVAGAGVGVVVLRRLDDALAEGDTIHALIRGSAINNDGAQKVGYTAPSVEGQARVISEALSVAGVDAGSLQYVEAHGSGTPLGDGVELKALGEVLGRGETGQPCALGSVKTNVGHLDAAAGVAALIKTALALRHGEIPPSLNCAVPQPGVKALGGRVFVNTALRPWTRNGAPRRAGVSSFGIGGTNAHVVLEEAPPREPSGPSRTLQVLVVSANTPTALAAAAERVAACLEDGDAPPLADAAYTLRTGRRELEYRLAVVCADGAEGAARLRRVPARGAAPVPRTERPVAFLFPGLGMHHVDMGRGLYGAEPGYREAVDACCDLLRPLLGEDLRAALFSPGVRNEGVSGGGGWDMRRLVGGGGEAAPSPLDDTRLAQPAVFVTEYAMAKLWMSWGVAPRGMLGHSLGEYVAACVAGVLRLPDALRMVALRARLIGALSPGTMLAVPLGEAALRAILPPGLDLAAVNTPESCVVAGPADEVAAFEAALTERGTVSRRLVAGHAFHSRAMTPVAAELERLLTEVELRAPEVPFVSNVTGTWITDDEARSPAYWARHLCGTVRFADGVAALRREPDWALLEVGPGQTLGAWALQHPSADTSGGGTVFSSLRHPHNRVDDLRFLLESLGGLWAAGVAVEWAAFGAGERRHRVPLPGYPFERRRYWVGPPRADAGPGGTDRRPEGRMPEEGMVTPMKSTPKGPDAMENAVAAANGTGASSRQRAVLGRLKEIAAELMGIDGTQIDSDVDLFRVGFDSLLLLQAIQVVEKRVGVRLSLVEMMEEMTTLDAIARHIDRVLPPDAVVGDAAPARAAPSAAGAPGRVPVPPAFFPPAATDAAGGDVLRDIVAQQLQAMNQLVAQQLSALTGTAAAPAVPARAVPQSPRARLQPETPYVAYQPLSTDASGLTPEQRAYLDEFTTRYVERTKASRAHQERYHDVLADSRVTARFRRAWKEILYPIVGARALGSRVWDLDGNEYVDVGMAFGCNLFGHAPEFVSRVIREQVETGYGVGPQSPDAGRAAALICELGGNDRAIFCNSGTEAVMGAIRAARAFTGRSKVVYFAGAYHGWSDITQGRLIGGAARPTAPGISALPLGDVTILEYDEPASLDRLAGMLDEVAVVMVEPVQSRRLDIQPHAFLHELRRMTREAGTLLHFDELVTGFRILPGGAQAFFGVDADLVTYGKVVASGLPMGVVAGKREPMSVFDGGTWRYGDDSYPTGQRTLFAGAFFKHPLSMAVACAILEEVRRQGTPMYERLNARTEGLVRRLNAWFEAEGVPITTVHFGSTFRFFYGREIRFPDLVNHHLIHEGVHIIPETGTGFLSTAHTDEDLDTVFRAMCASVTALRRGGFIPSPSGAPAVSATAPSSTPAAAGADTDAREGGVRAIPLTDGQRQLWIESQMGEDACRAYVESSSTRLRGALDVEALRGAVQALADRHEALRTTFAPDGETQLVHPAATLEVPLADLRGVPAAEREARLETLVRRTVHHPFDLARGPLVRFSLAVLADDEHVLVFAAHHAVLDGWSIGVLFRELDALYAARKEGRDPGLVPRPDHAALVRAHVEGTQDPAAHAYWTARFADGVPVLALPSDRPRPPARSYRGERVTRVVDDALVRRLVEAGWGHRLTLFHTLLAAVSTWLGRLAGQDDVVVGTPAAGQSGRIEGAELVGYGIRVLPLRARLDPSAPFLEHAGRVRRSVMEGLEHQGFSFSRLVDELLPRRDGSRPALFAAAMYLDREPAGHTMFGLPAVAEGNFAGGARADLALGMVETADLRLRLDCDFATDLFEPETVERWLAGFERLLEQVARDPGVRLGELDLLGAEERARVLVEWNGASRDLPAGCVHEWVEAQAAAAPDAPAVQAEDGALGYGALNARANRLAHHLAAQGVGPEARVALSLERGAELVTAMLAVMKAGGAYVPLDPAYPAERRAWMVADSGASVLVTRGGDWEGEAPPGVAAVWLDADAEAVAARPDTNPGVRPAAENLAYVVYTSGSTGQPKGVGVAHGGLAVLCAAQARDLGITAEARASQLVSAGFDASVLEIWPFLACGASLHVVSDALRLDLPALQRWVVEHRITHAHMPPPLAGPLLEMPWPRGTALRTLVTGGERLTVPPPPDAPFEVIVGYGVTECTVASTSARVDAARLSSIGRPTDNARVYVLDGALRPVPVGVLGEICLGGAQVARGYVGRPGLTAERYVPDPFSAVPGARMYRTGDVARWGTGGTLEFVGRLDGQVKVRGVRVEPGEIEAVLRRHRAVRECAVLARDDGGEQRLVAYVVGAATAAELRQHLRFALPEYMVPSAFVALEALPLNANGKVDRAALPAPDLSAAAPERYAAPAGALEETLAGLWREVLGVERVGRHDAFFELGGHSLKVAQLHARLGGALGREVPVTDLFRFPTVASLAEHLGAPPEAEPRPGAGSERAAKRRGLAVGAAR